MKQKLFILVILGYACSSFAWISTAPAEKTYTFKFQLRKEILEIKRTAASYEDAFQSAAPECASYFRKNVFSGHLSEDQKLDIVDTCANPRS